MFAACGQCGHAFCLTHFVRSTRKCLSCADRCSRALCQMLTSTRCKRCGDSLCASHRHKASERCPSCERWFRGELSKLEEDEGADAKERRDDRRGSFIMVGIWALVGLSSFSGLAVLVGVTGLASLGGLYWALRHGHPTRQKRKARRRFLAERPPKLLGR